MVGLVFDVLHCLVLHCCCSCEDCTPLPTLLQPLLDSMQLPAKKLVVNRKDILRSFYHGLKSGRVDFNSPVEVKFSGEEAVDEGGPRREFFRSVLTVNDMLL